MINKLFDLLDDWQKLPSYQLERRADIFFALFLDKIIEQKFSINIDYILPEFPIRKDDLPNHCKYNKKPLNRPNQSFHIDYLAYSKSSNKVYLIELKTEMESRNDKQDWYLKEAVQLGVNGLVDGIFEIAKVTKQVDKYAYLLSKINEMGWVEENLVQMNDLECQVIYIQPCKDDSNKTIITFDDVITELLNIKVPISNRFAESLEVWKPVCPEESQIISNTNLK